MVSNETAAILSLLRRYQALALVQTAEARLLATLGLEPQIGSTGQLSLKELTEQLRRSPPAWSQMMGKPVSSLDAAPAGPAVAAQAQDRQRGQW
jgi:hypothetical protein